ncbi:V-type ATPase subunit [Miniphocaeibacter halophilus]|uniref:V-type ATPase subunit n=1 Tax=Miniphocaeibacter halophilus TaxID=2931922 RepID=A0AC61MPB0_9FIRM|nr:V-type ATPase subunit [Miniphocaeibacter halophilus]QQK07357.1 V-type ATPase subunit [Miniphocaeibacter halophilus]
MNSAKEFSALNSKISSMKKNLLQEEDYESLIGFKKIEEVIDYLYEREFIVNKNYNSINEIESDLKKNRLKILNKLGYFLSKNYNNLVQLILDKYEIEDIKKATRNLVTKNKALTKESFIIRDDFYEKIKEGITIEEFFEELKNSKFYKYLRGYKNQEKRDLLFFVEMSLDRNYYSSIFFESKYLNKENEKIIKNFYGQFIDLYNLSWIYRAKKFYNIKPVIIYNYTILGGDLFNTTDIKNLSYMELEDFVDNILKTKYSFLFDSKHNIDIYMERRINRYLYYQSRDLTKSNKFNFKKTLGIIVMTDFDIKDIGAILESKNYNLTSEETRGYLIKNLGRS